jgi:hypothetical protein
LKSPSETALTRHVDIAIYGYGSKRENKPMGDRCDLIDKVEEATIIKHIRSDKPIQKFIKVAPHPRTDL